MLAYGSSKRTIRFSCGTPAEIADGGFSGSPFGLTASGLNLGLPLELEDGEESSPREKTSSQFPRPSSYASTPEHAAGKRPFFRGEVPISVPVKASRVRSWEASPEMSVKRPQFRLEMDLGGASDASDDGRSGCGTASYDDSYNIVLSGETTTRGLPGNKSALLASDPPPPRQQHIVALQEDRYYRSRMVSQDIPRGAGEIMVPPEIWHQEEAPTQVPGGTGDEDDDPTITSADEPTMMNDSRTAGGPASLGMMGTHPGTFRAVEHGKNKLLPKTHFLSGRSRGAPMIMTPIPGAASSNRQSSSSSTSTTGEKQRSLFFCPLLAENRWLGFGHTSFPAITVRCNCRRD